MRVLPSPSAHCNLLLAFSCRELAHLGYVESLVLGRFKPTPNWGWRVQRGTVQVCYPRKTYARVAFTISWGYRGYIGVI